VKAIIIAPAPPGEGGLGAAALDMADGLAALGIDVQHVGRERNTHARRIASHRPLRRFPQLLRELDRRAIARQVPREWHLAYAMPGFLPSEGPGVRIVHQATRHPRTVRAALAKARAAAGGGRGFMTRREEVRLERELAAADLIRVESLAVFEELVEGGLPRERVIHAYPGVDLDAYVPGNRPDHLQVAFIGPLALWKGLDIVSDLATRLRAGEALGMVGGPVCPWSRRIVASTPHTPFSDVRTLLATSHALVLPSASDGFGRVVLEAMASETVPFVSPEVGAAEIVRRIDGRLVQPRDSFAQTVIELLRSLPLPALGRRAREVAGDFDRRLRVPEAAEKVAAAASLHSVGVK
jgi:glycosyltransferase involved in cell wall biosynthesis